MNERPGIRELECFVAVAEELNFVRAARLLRLSQPPITRHIQKLEERLGVPLFIRNSRQVQLTSAGILFLADVRELLRNLDRATTTVRQAHNGQVHRLSIGFVGALLEGEMIATLRTFRTLQNNCQIRLHDMLSPDLINAVLNKQIDGAFIGATPQKLDPSLHTLFWKKEIFKVALPQGHPLSQVPVVDLRSLSDEKWITLQEKASPALYQLMLQICEAAGFRPTVVEESDRWTAIIAMVSLGEGVCLIPDSATRIDTRLEVSNVIFKPLIQPDAILERAFLYHSQNTSPLFGSLTSYLLRRRQQCIGK